MLDICDTASQIFDILDAHVNAGNNITNYQVPNPGVGQAGTRAAPINSIYNEYNHRPISATSLVNPQGGDCVQTLYRHLVNVAVQNDSVNARNYNIGHLPNALKNDYYGPVHVLNWNPGVTIAPNVLTIPAIKGEAGVTWLAYHQSWHDALSNGAINAGNISNGTLADIVRVLTAIAAATHPSALQNRQMAGIQFQANALVLSAGGRGAGDQDVQDISNALNTIDGRGADTIGANRFQLDIYDNPNIPNLNWATTKIEIIDNLWERKITVGAGGHAEITNIQ